MKRLAVIDYGMGNLLSVEKAFEYIGAKTVITDDEAVIRECDGIILPGVGAFPDAMKNLSARKLDTLLKTEAEKKPLLGICLGMQLLFDRGYEFEKCAGLGLIAGEVKKMESATLKIPHMGWNSLIIKRESPLLKGINAGKYVYFVHSYMGIAENPDSVIACTDYGGEVTAAVGRGNIFGCQFHPEKSSDVGLRILKNFWDIV